MTNEDLITAWRDLRAQRTLGEDLIATTPVARDGRETGLELAVDAAGDLHLLARVEGAAERNLPPDYNSLRLRQVHMAGEEWLDLHSPAAHETMFAALCGQFIEAVLADQRDPWAAAVSIVRSWQSAWRPLRQPMSRSRQIGLAGELLVLRLLWLPALGSDAIHMWSGPDQERHDFVSDRLHIEVKTTMRSRHEHEISRVDQLTAPVGRRLLLASVQLEESVAGADSLATLIDAVLGAIRRDGAALDVFLTALSVLGWTDEMRRSPELIRFNVRDAQIFEVDDEFPALPKGFELPAGVLAIRYTISLANLPVLDSADVAEAIRECHL